MACVRRDNVLETKGLTEVVTSCEPSRNFLYDGFRLFYAGHMHAHKVFSRQCKYLMKLLCNCDSLLVGACADFLQGIVLGLFWRGTLHRSLIAQPVGKLRESEFSMGTYKRAATVLSRAFHLEARRSEHFLRPTETWTHTGKAIATKRQRP